MPKLKLSAVTIPAMHATVFVVNLVPETIPASVDRSDWTIDDGVRLHAPDDLYAWPDGAEAPGVAVLCQSRDDSKHYEVFKRLDDVDAAQFVPTPMNYGGVYSESHWGNLVRDFSRISKFLQVPDAEFPDVAASVLPNAKRGY